jgi:mono/diheme cytochrome c family protein
MADGRGVPGMQPSLASSAVVAGQPKTLIDLMLRGPDVALPPGRERTANTMQPFAHLSDDDIAAVLSFARRKFGNAAEDVSSDEVAALRQQLGAAK